MRRGRSRPSARGMRVLVIKLGALGDFVRQASIESSLAPHHQLDSLQATQTKVLLERRVQRDAVRRAVRTELVQKLTHNLKNLLFDRAGHRVLRGGCHGYEL